MAVRATEPQVLNGVVAVPGLIAIECGRLTLCRLDGDDQEVLSVERALRLEFAGPVPVLATPTPEPSPAAAQVGPGIVFEASPILAVPMGGHLLAIDGLVGSWVILDARHLHVATAIDHVASIDHLRAVTQLDDSALTGVLDDLERLGLVTVEREAAPSSETAPPPPPRTVDEPETAAPAPRWTARRIVTGAARRTVRLTRRVLATGSPTDPVHVAAPPATVTAPPPSPAAAEPITVVAAAPDPAGEEPSGSTDAPAAAASASADPPEPSRRIPVLPFWATDDGPHLGSAAVVAFARVYQDGALNDTYELRRVARAEEVLETISRQNGPAVLLCSNYVWSVEANLDVARRAVDANPATVVFHGGPSTPGYDADCEEFLRQLPGRHVTVKGEGEVTFAAALEALSESTSAGDPDLTALADVAGLSYIDPRDGRLVRTGERDRHVELSEFPSPLLSGELDDVDPDLLRKVALPIETNRGCPYACTFCDWGQATMTRLRKFPLDRVFAELEWLADHRIELWIMADSNFGMLPRDLDVTEEIVRLRRTTTFPQWIAVAPPKNTTKRFVDILDRILSSGISMKAALALQTRDVQTLDDIRRSNIKVDAYDELKAELRRRGLPLACELMMGLPGATVESFRADLQWAIEEQVRAHMWPTFVLPNAPMNEPTYREHHEIKTIDGLIVSTSSFTEADRRHMDDLAYAYQVFEVIGTLRHLLRFLQWDHGLRAMDVVEQLSAAARDRPLEYPLLAWTLRHLDVFMVPPLGWGPFFDEVRRFVVDELGVEDDSALNTVIEVSRFLMPVAGRTYPDSIELDHDYVAYWNEAVQILDAGLPARPPEHRLEDLGPGRLEILADPDDTCSAGLKRVTAERDTQGFHGDFWNRVHWETLSPLTTYLPLSPGFVATARERMKIPDIEATDTTTGDPEPEDGPEPLAVSVSLGERQSSRRL